MTTNDDPDFEWGQCIECKEIQESGFINDYGVCIDCEEEEYDDE